jgi:hypothetical protein
VDEKSLAQGERTVRVDQEHRSCFYCLEGWVFLGSIGTTAKRSSKQSAAVGAAVRAG